VGCRSLTLSLSSIDWVFGNPATLQSSPLLAMPQLREVRLAQAAWSFNDVESVLHLQQVSRFAPDGSKSTLLSCGN
jgi:hypothetical protein